MAKIKEQVADDAKIVKGQVAENTKDAEGRINSAASAAADQALQVADVVTGASAAVADAVAKAVEQLRDPETRTKELETLRSQLNTEIDKAGQRGGEVRRQATDQFTEQVRKARERVEPVYRDRVEPVYRDRVEPVVSRVRDRSETAEKETVKA